MNRSVDKSGLSEKEIALHFELHHNFFASMKCLQREKYNYILSKVPGNMLESYRTYLKEMEEVKLKVESIYFWLEENRKIFAFSKYLYKKGIFKHSHTFSSNATITIFNSSSKFKTISSFLRYKKIIKQFEYFKKELSDHSAL